MTPEGMVTLLEDFAHQAKNWNDIGRLLRTQNLDTPDNPLWAFVFAFEYMFVEDTQEEYKARYGDYAPWIELADGRIFPPPLHTLDETVFQSWDAVFQVSNHPVITSRLGDLLWVTKWSEKPFVYVAKAIDSFIQIVETRIDWNELEISFCLTRGLELALQISNLDKARIYIQNIHVHCLNSLTEKKPGVTIRLLDAMLSVKRNLLPVDLTALLEQCVEVYSDDPWILDEILTRQAKYASDNGEKAQILEQQVNIWVSQAEKSSGIAHAAHLQRALELARNYGFTEKTDELRRRIQNISDESLGLKELSVTTHISADRIEKFIQSLVDPNDWRKSFSKFGIYGPPSGNYAQNLQEVDKQFEESPLRFLVTNVIYDKNNAPVYVGKSVDENKQLVLIQNEVMATEMFSVFAPEILNRICQTAGLPDRQELTEYFTTAIIPSEIAENIAASFDWYFKEEYDVSAHLLIPRIEAIFRIIARMVGIAVIREAVGKKAGGVITLAELLSSLKDRMDESWRRYFLTLLVNPLGINLRNRVCHGLTTKVDNRNAALLLQVTCFLRHLEIHQVISELGEK